MAWIESHTILLRHRKLIALAKALRLKPVYCLGHLHALWHVAMEQAEDGDLSSWTDEFVAESAGFQGDAPRFVSLLQTHGWLDGKILHDWLEYAGRFLHGKYSGKRGKLVDIYAKHGRIYGETAKQPPSNRQVTAKLPPTTLPDLTVPKPKKANPPDKPPAVPMPKGHETNGTKPPGDGSSTPKHGEYTAPKTDVQKVVMAFKLTMGVPRDDRAWDGVYFRRYSRAAGDLLTLFQKDVGRVADCIEAVAGSLKRKGLSWTPETIVKHASDWKEGKLFK
jgi:hypothetical protein